MKLALDRLRSSPLGTEPFEHVIVPRFVERSAFVEAVREFPRIDGGGSVPVSALSFGPAFAGLLEEARRERAAGARWRRSFAWTFEDARRSSRYGAELAVGIWISTASSEPSASQ